MNRFQLIRFIQRYFLALIASLAVAPSCAVVKEDPKVADCNAFADAYQGIEDRQVDPSEAIEPLENGQNPEQWITSENDARMEELNDVSGVLQALSLEDDQIILARDTLMKSFETAAAENTALLQITADFVKLGSNDIKDLGGVYSKTQSQRSKIADIKRQRADLLRAVNTYCDINLPLPFGNT